MRTEGSNKAVAFAAIVFMLFGGYFAYAAFLTGQPSSVPFVSPVEAGDDDEEEEDENEDEDEDKDDDEDKDEDKDDDRSGSGKDDDEEAREAAKKAAERTREAAKRAAEGDDDMDDDQNEVEDELEDENEEENENEREDEGMYQDRAKTIAKLNEKIAEAEKHILEKQGEGVDISAAMAQLALAKAGLSSVDAAFAVNQLDQVKALAKEAERLAHYSQGKTLHDSEESAKDIAKVEKRIKQTESKIVALAGVGGDASDYLERLAELKSLFVGVQAQIAAGGESQLAGLVALEVVERRVKTLKDAVEGALLAYGVSDDDDFKSEHSEEVEDSVEDLLELAEDEDDLKVIAALAPVYKAEVANAEKLLDELEDRNAVAAALFGPDDNILDALRNKVAINEGYIQTMQLAANQYGDDRFTQEIGDLEKQNDKLAHYIAQLSTKTGLFGWFFNWL